MSTNELELQRMKSVCADTGFSRSYVYKLDLTTVKVNAALGSLTLSLSPFKSAIHQEQS